MPEKYNKPLCYSAIDYIQTIQIFLLKNGRLFTLEGTQTVLQWSSLSYLLRFPTWFYNAFSLLLFANNCLAFFPSLHTDSLSAEAACLCYMAHKPECLVHERCSVNVEGGPGASPTPFGTTPGKKIPHVNVFHVVWTRQALIIVNIWWWQK